MQFRECLFAFTLILLYSRQCLCIRMKDQITIVIPDVKQYCIRLLNGTTSVGCQSERTGNMGSVTVINEPSDLSREFADLPYGITEIIAVVNVEKFRKPLIDSLRKADFVAGILLIAENGIYPSNFSEDSACPNENFYVRTKTELQVCQWNREGAIHPQGLRFLSFDKPIFLLTNSSDIDVIVNKCYDAFNRNGNNRRCMAHLTQFMHAAGNAELCQRRDKLSSFSTCDALKDYNLFAVIPPRTRVSANNASIFMLSARMDMLSTFANSEGGDVSSLTSIIALLAVADAIGGKKLKYFQEKARENGRQLMFSFFHGESMGYIGSSRMVWEMNRHEFPAPQNVSSQPSANVQQIGLDDLYAFYEVQHIQFHELLHLHSSFDVYARNKTLLDEIVFSTTQASREYALGVLFHKDKSVPFPPSSYHSILRHTTNIPGIILSTYENSYASGQINSVADQNMTRHPDRIALNTRFVHTTAHAILRTVVDHVLGENEAKNFSVNADYVKELMECFFLNDNWNCPLFKTLLNVTKMPADARYMFISVTGTSFIRRVINALLVRSLGDKELSQNVNTESQCKDLNKNQNVHHFVWQNDPDSKRAFCYTTSIYTTLAKSPAFDEDSYDFRNGTYSTWMESLWDSHSHLDLYLKADMRLDVYAVLTALVVVIASIPLKLFMRESWFIDSHEPPTTPHQL